LLTKCTIKEENLHKQIHQLKEKNKKVKELKAENSTLQENIICFEKEIQMKDNDIQRWKVMKLEPHLQTKNVLKVINTGATFSPTEHIKLNVELTNAKNELIELKKKTCALEVANDVRDPVLKEKVTRLLKEKTALKQCIEYFRRRYGKSLEQIQIAIQQGFRIQNPKKPLEKDIDDFKPEDVADHEIRDSIESADTSEEESTKESVENDSSDDDI